MHSCLLVGSAPTEHKGLDLVLEKCHFDAIYAVDGGFKAITERNVIPHQVCGDFDSLGYVPEEEVKTFSSNLSGSDEINLEVFDSHKDFSDMEWALNHATEKGFTNIVMCDGLYGRLDHSLGNLQLMAYAAQNGQRVWGITEDEIILTLNAAGGLMKLDIDAGTTGTVSVFSHSDESIGVSELGLEYKLENAHLTNKTTLGLSNELMGSAAQISLKKGCLWIFLPLSALEYISYAGVKLA